MQLLHTADEDAGDCSAPCRQTRRKSHKPAQLQHTSRRKAGQRIQSRHSSDRREQKKTKSGKSSGAWIQSVIKKGILLKQGRKPAMDEVAKEALVSRATAYRDFPSINALLVEVPVDESVGNPGAIFANRTSDDAEARVDEAEAFMHKVVYENEALLRIMLANSIGRNLEDDTLPNRQNRRVPLIEAALATSRHRFRDDDYERLCAALAMIFGPESMMVFRDVLRVDEKTARQVKSWAVRALVRAALQHRNQTRSRNRVVPTQTPKPNNNSAVSLPFGRKT